MTASKTDAVGVPDRRAASRESDVSTAHISEKNGTCRRPSVGPEPDAGGERTAFKDFPNPWPGAFTEDRAIEFLDERDRLYLKGCADRPTHEAWKSFAKQKLGVLNPTAQRAWKAAKIGASFRGSPGRPRKI